MGLIAKRVAFSLLVLLAVLLPLRAPETSPVASTAPTLAKRYYEAVGRYHVAHQAWTAFDLRDSAAAVLGATAAVASHPAIAWRGFAAGSTPVSRADSTVSALWRGIGTPRADVTTAVLIYNTAAYGHPAYSGAMVTNTGGRAACVAIVPGEVATDGNPDVWPRALASAMSPCVLLATFGAPGTAVSDWLNATGYESAGSNAWLAPESSAMQIGPWAEWYNNFGNNDPLGGVPRWLGASGLMNFAALREPPYRYGAAGLRCIDGDELSCTTSVLHPSLARPDPRLTPLDLTGRASMPGGTSLTVASVRPPNQRFIASLISQFGRERFERFWTSSRGFEPAFQDAFGVSLGSWTARWARETWTTSYEARHELTDIALGVTLKPYWLLGTIAWSGVALLIAAAVAKRRTA